MKGIILAGGKGTRLYPSTIAVSKQLLPIYDKPLVYYPLSVLLMAGIKDILIITTPRDNEAYRELLGDGHRLGVNLEYKIQDKPNGLAEAFILGEEFIGDDDVCLVLGDNIFYGQGFGSTLSKIVSEGVDGAIIFGYPVMDPREYGVVEFDAENRVISIEEKPKEPKSKYAVPGLYFYDNNVSRYAKEVQYSDRGELEITALNNIYLSKNKLYVELLGRGMAWLDTGSPSNMLKASEYVESVQTLQGLYIACIEEICWRKGFINDEQLRKAGKELEKTAYGKYILSLLPDTEV